MKMNTQINKKAKQGGFTLVEIAIVLVIIGLILGGVLQGQTMIENAKYKKFVKEVDSYRTAYYTFQDMFQALPGDLKKAKTLLDASAVNGSGNGLIDGSTCSVATEESCNVWAHFRYAELISGDPTDSGTDAIPTHAYGAQVHMFNTTAGNSIGKNKMYFTTVPGSVGQRYDNEYDDGDGNSGNISQSANSATYSSTANVNLYIEL